MVFDQFIVRVPASTSNLGPGFDTLGLALDLYTDYTVRRLEKKEPSRVTGEAGGEKIKGVACPFLPMMERIFALAGAKPQPVEVEVRGEAPIGMGLGWSAGACVAGALAANTLLGMPFSREFLLGPLIQAEGHPDNVTPSLMGGLTATVQTPHGPVFRIFAPVEFWRVALLVPGYALPTKEARKALPGKVPLADAVFNISRVPLVIDALVRGDAAMLGQVLEDRLHEPYRADLIKKHDKIRKAARHAGAVATFISGAGPAIAAFCKGEDAAEGVLQAMLDAVDGAGFKAHGHVLTVEMEGARVAEGD
jgi:homoserine kinase